MQQKKLKDNKSSNSKLRKSQFIKIGSLILMISGISLLGIKYYGIFKENKTNEEKINNFFENQENLKDKLNITPSVATGKVMEVSKDDYIAVIEIPKINLKRGLYDGESSKNNVNNIEILKESDMPDEKYGNFILAGHSGSGIKAHFRNLKKLETGDMAYIYYNNARYEYKLVSKYEIEKTGTASVVRNANHTTLTLITCKDNSDKQLVFIFDLKEEN